jgi:hypothetical protein
LLQNRFAVEAAHAALGWKSCMLSDSPASMPHSLSAVYIHLVFSTRNREPSFRDKQLRQEIIELFKVLPPAERAQVTKFVVENDDSWVPANSRNR